MKQKIKEIGQKLKKVFTQDKKRVIVLIVLIVVALIAAIALIFSHNDQKGSKKNKEDQLIANTSEKIIADAEFQGLTFSNTVLLIQNGYSTITMDVTNNSDKAIDLEQVGIKFLDKNNQEIVSLMGYIGDQMEVGEVRNVTASAKVNLKDAKEKQIVEYVKPS
mgnify:CR=1 FL=1